MMREPQKKESKLLLLVSIVVIFSVIVLFVGPEMAKSRLQQWNLKEDSDIGSIFGGTLSPFIAWMAAMLTFAAFWVQYQANQQQKNQFKKQAQDTAVERFENKFFALLELHRKNLEEITIAEKIKSRKAFIDMFNELKFTFHVVEWYYTQNYRVTFKSEIPSEIIYNISYLIFFFGIGENSSKIITDLIGEKYEGFFKNAEAILIQNQIMWRKEKKLNKNIAVETENGVFTLKLPYKPFDGHMSRLSHYVRHLFQMVKFIDDQSDDIIDYDSKYNYAATVRAQLSTHEQLLLYYNSISVLGKPWLDKDKIGNNYIEKYCMVKSSPLPLADFYIIPSKLLPQFNFKGKQMFEWGEIKDRLNFQQLPSC